MATEATISVNVNMSEFEHVKRLIVAASDHVKRAKEKHTLTTPDECYEPTMAELWRALLALQEWLDEPAK